MEHPTFLRTGVAADLAHDIVSMQEEIRYWQRESDHWQSLAETHMEASEKSRDHTMGLIGTVLGAALDPESGLNRMHRALERDPLKGAQA